MEKVRWLIRIAGPTEGKSDGVNPGDLMDLPDSSAERYLRIGYVTKLLEGPLPPVFQLGEILPASVRDERFAAQSRKT
jgi:hypothetical protein